MTLLELKADKRTRETRSIMQQFVIAMDRLLEPAWHRAHKPHVQKMVYDISS